VQVSPQLLTTLKLIAVSEAKKSKDIIRFSLFEILVAITFLPFVAVFVALQPS
jgi:hypothetical protein